jgi:hypothetical protein
VEQLTLWTNISVIWLAFLSFILGVVPLVILYFAVRGMMIVNRTVPRYLKLGQYYSGLVRDQTHKYSQMSMEPVIRVFGEANRVEQIARSLQPRAKSINAQPKE